jgi:1,4-dihydroxy-2-naphthoate octaprenyltransferase
MTTNVQKIALNEDVTISQKLIGLIRLTRPQFLIAYLIVGLGGIVLGIKQGFVPDISIAIYSIITVLLSAVGVHYRDEAGDWSAGYDLESGGMGVIRDGTLNENTVRSLGRIISIITIIMGISQAIILYYSKNQPILLIIGIPIFIMITFVNYLTEEIPLGHEIITTGSYLATFYWIYLAQAWSITISVFYFSVFIYLIVFALVPYQDIGDLDVDSKTGKRTLTRKLGLDGLGHLSIFIGLTSLLFLYLALLS